MVCYTLSIATNEGERMNELDNFYHNNQDELEEEWNWIVQNKYCESGDFDHNNEDNFWEFVEEQMEKAKAISEGYL